MAKCKTMKKINITKGKRILWFSRSRIRHDGRRSGKNNLISGDCVIYNLQKQHDFLCEFDHLAWMINRQEMYKYSVIFLHFHFHFPMLHFLSLYRLCYPVLSLVEFMYIIYTAARAVPTYTYLGIFWVEYLTFK